MPLVCVCSPKGGVGKTTVTANLAWALARAGSKVLAIDFDVQNALRLHFGVPLSDGRGYVAKAGESSDWSQSVLTAGGNIFVLPYGDATEAQRLDFEQRLANDSHFLQRGLGTLLNYPGLVIIADFPPGPNPALKAVSRIADLHLITLLADTASLSLLLLLSHLQTLFPLKREIVPLPDDTSLWPTVDVYIPTYNESLDVVRDTVLAAQCIDYPQDKMKIYLLDDGKRSEFAVFAANVGVGYITRNDNSHAKAGNLNHAMKLTSGELITVFDCDHVATRIFLQATVGAFLQDPKLALIQTPHYFYSPDPFERNLSVGRDIPNEGALFYGPIQRGNDFWNATFFCGSCAVIRRSALEEIGGFAVETVTEDAHTALKMQRRGWKSSFLDIPLAAGLATERLVLHVIQRTRWARGMTQIFRTDNPLFGRGLAWQQRLCYLSAMLYYQFALPRVAFLTAPLAYLLFNLNIIHSSASMLFAYALPHLFLAIWLNSRLNGRYRYSFWGEIYDLVMAFHLILPTAITMLFPKRGKFNVTDKGDLLDVGYFDFRVVRPHVIVAVLLAMAVIAGIVRACAHDYFGVDPKVIALNVGWGLYSLIFLLAAIAVARETQQTRKTIRIEVDVPVVIHYASGISSRSHTLDLSMGGCRIKVPDERHLTDEIEEVELQLHSGAISIPMKVIASDESTIRLMYEEIPLARRRELVRVVLARAARRAKHEQPNRLDGSGEDSAL